jgi:hypothetical protein
MCSLYRRWAVPEISRSDVTLLAVRAYDERDGRERGRYKDGASRRHMKFGEYCDDDSESGQHHRSEGADPCLCSKFRQVCSNEYTESHRRYDLTGSQRSRHP